MEQLTNPLSPHAGKWLVIPRAGEEANESLREFHVERENLMHNNEVEGQAFSRVLIALMKGIVYRDTDADIWQALLDLQARVRDYLAALGLELMLDEAEGYAWLRTRPASEEVDALPRLVAKRPLSYPVSLLLALLRRKLAEFDSGGEDTRLILARDEVADMVRLFLPAGVNEARIVDQIDTHLNKIIELGFARRMRGQPHLIEVRRILKAFVDAQWLAEFDRRLAAYRIDVLGANSEQA
ncbi:MAG TPA: DUF4194 domain-containing protein [Gallionella sp.]|nr:DUF4194 domain-containing protein [Gallionella sp.]